MTVKINQPINAFGPATPCIVCEKALAYVELGVDKVKYPDCIVNGTNFDVVAGYGSDFDGHCYEAVICDECLDKAIQKSQVVIKPKWIKEEM